MLCISKSTCFHNNYFVFTTISYLGYKVACTYSFLYTYHSKTINFLFVLVSILTDELSRKNHLWTALWKYTRKRMSTALHNSAIPKVVKEYLQIFDKTYESKNAIFNFHENIQLRNKRRQNLKASCKKDVEHSANMSNHVKLTVINWHLIATSLTVLSGNLAAILMYFIILGSSAYLDIWYDQNKKRKRLRWSGNGDASNRSNNKIL